MEQKQERGKGKRDVEPWGIRHATAEDAAFSGIPADLMDITLHWFLGSPPPPQPLQSISRAPVTWVLWKKKGNWPFLSGGAVPVHDYTAAVTPAGVLCLLNPAITAYSAVRYVPDSGLRITVSRLISDYQPPDQHLSKI